MEIKKLKALLSSSSKAKLLFDAILNDSCIRDLHPDHITVNTAKEVLSSLGVNAQRGHVIDILQQFAECEFGWFVTGRRGKQSRLQFPTKIAALKNDLARDLNEADSSGIEPSEALSENCETPSLRHLYNLRPNYSVNFELPTNLTGNEASRLAKFIESLPMA